MSSSSSSTMEVPVKSMHESIGGIYQVFLSFARPRVEPLFMLGYEPLPFTVCMRNFFDNVPQKRKKIEDLKGWMSNLETRYRPGREHEIWEICKELDELERNTFGSSSLQAEMEALKGRWVSLLKVVFGHRALARPRDARQELARFSPSAVGATAGLESGSLIDETGAEVGLDDVMKALRKCEIRSLKDNIEIASGLVKDNSAEYEGGFPGENLKEGIMEISSSIGWLEKDEYCRKYFPEEMEGLRSQFSSLSRLMMNSVQDSGNPCCVSGGADLEGASISTGLVGTGSTCENGDVGSPMHAAVVGIEDVKGAWNSKGSVGDASACRVVNVESPMHAANFGGSTAHALVGNNMVKLKDGISSVSRNVTDHFTSLFGSSGGEYMPIGDLPMSIDLKTVKMNNKTGRIPLLPQKHSQDGESEHFANFAYFALILSYAGLYCLLSATFGRTTDENSKIMTGIHGWTFLMVMALFLGSYIRCSIRVLKLMRMVMSVLLFLSAFVVFILLEITL